MYYHCATNADRRGWEICNAIGWAPNGFMFCDNRRGELLIRNLWSGESSRFAPETLYRVAVQLSPHRAIVKPTGIPGVFRHAECFRPVRNSHRRIQ